MTDRLPVVLTTDLGTEVDDQWALSHLALSPEFDLLGIVTTHAPNVPSPAAESSANAVREVLDNLPLSKLPPVFAGSSVPLAEKSKPYMNDGVEFIINYAKGFTKEKPLTVLAIGAATDVASTLIAQPKLPIRVIAMGFQGWEEGGDEWNVNNDVRAWQVIFESNCDVTIGCAQVAIRDLKLSGQEARNRFGDKGSAGKYLTEMLVDWLDRNPEVTKLVTGSSGTWPMWDQITVAYLLGVTEAVVLPSPVLQDDRSFVKPPRENSTVRWITKVDADALWSDLAKKMI